MAHIAKVRVTLKDRFQVISDDSHFTTIWQATGTTSDINPGTVGNALSKVLNGIDTGQSLQM